MKRKTNMLLAGLSIVAIVALWGCTGGTAPTDSENPNETSTEATAVNAAEGSLLAKHAEGALTADSPVSKLDCFGACHDRETITKATEEYCGTTKNPHNSPHEMLDCEDCHSLAGESVLTCMKCHDGLELPSGWVAPTDDKPQANA